MSQAFGRKNMQDSGTPRKCRIPQRVGSGKHRPLSKSKDIRQARPESENGGEVQKDNNVNDENLSMCQETTVLEQEIPSKNYLNHKKYFSEEQMNEIDLTKTLTHNPIELKEGWKVKREQFEKMKNDLNERQGAIMEAYAALKTTEEKLALMGQKMSSTIIDNDLRIMNVAKMTPRQLLQLCGETKACSGDIPVKEELAATYFNIDMKIMYDFPSKVYETCQEALKISKVLLDWLENFKKNEKDLFYNNNRRKINDFKAEYDILNNKVQAVKTELGKDQNEIINIVRKCVNETIAVSLRNQDLTNELSQLNSKNSLLQKQINDKDQVFKLHPNKIKIEELEKKIKEEKLKNVTARDRSKKLENKSKMNENRAIHLEVTLNQAKAQNHVLEQTIQNQQEQVTNSHIEADNQQSQKEFNEELCKLTDSIKENTKNLEKIAEAKIKVQNEKEELEIRLISLSEEYNKSINNLKMEISSNIKRVVEMEKKYKEELDEKTKLQNTVQTQQSQLAKKDERYKVTLKLLHETEAKLSETLKNRGNTIQVSKVVEKDLEETQKENESLNIKIMEQNKLIEAMQKDLDSAKMLEGQLRSQINKKTKDNEDQEKKYFSLEDKTKESELKMQFYEKQLMTLKENIKNLNDKYIECGNLNELNNTITKQNQKIRELNQRNDELTRELHSQTMDLKTCMHTISAQEVHIKEKDALLSELSEKEKEQTSNIEFLQRSLASKVNKTDNEVNGKLIEKDSEIKNLIVHVGTKEKRISQMEKVMIALYDQARKTKLKNKKYQEKINNLKQVISEYETYIENMNVDSQSEHLVSLIQILENEMETAIYPSDERNFKADFLNKKHKPIKSERMPYFLIQKERSLSRGEPLRGDGHSSQDLHVT